MKCRFVSKQVMNSKIDSLSAYQAVNTRIALIQCSFSRMRCNGIVTIKSDVKGRSKTRMEQIKRALRKLEQLQEDTDVQGNSASSIMRETGNFLQHDLDEVITLLKDAQNELESKTTPKVAPSEVAD